MLSFEEYFLESTSTYTPRPSDIFFHGSVDNFEPSLITGNKHKDGLVYLTRNIEHVLDYAVGQQTSFGSHAPVAKGFVYAYKINPSAKIFDATQNREHWGHTEILQDPENRGDTVFKYLNQGYDGILQKQADMDFYGDFNKRSVKRSSYSKRDGKEKWRKAVPLESGFRGTQVLGIKPEFLVPFKKIPIDDAYAGLHPDEKPRPIRSKFFKDVRQSS